MANRLARATSPYLLQHAENPVDWFEWGEEAFVEARRRDVAILLSVGYAACHWCHVMAHESFEDPGTAALMNERFVCVKVDREERPDVDAVYMDAVQAMSGHGGWPMTVFLTPTGMPFYAGTYFPPQDRHGMPGFPRVLEGIAQAWRDRREELVAQGARIVEHLARPLEGGAEPLTEDILAEALANLRGSFDPEWGGFGPAPKFPQPTTLELLLRLHLRGFEGALDMARVTLDRMATGGIHDQVGGGFHRYSTDGRWHVPHFEKMLYDNAQLALVYLNAWQVTGEEGYRTVCARTLDYLLRELRAPGGGFFSSQDADTEGVEGRFYVWSWEELVSAGGEDFARRLGATPEGNWEGTNVPLIELAAEGADRIAAYQEVVADEAFLASQERLFAERERRERPATDDKVLAGWNGLAIRAFAEAGRALGEPRYVDAAEVAAGFVLSSLRRDDGRLLRAWRDGRTSGPAYAEDHALLAAGLLALYETTFDVRWFREARSLAEDLLRLFHDEERGGFFQVGADQEALVVRPKEVFDNAVPSGNSVAAEVLLRLGLLTGEARYETAAASALRLVRGHLGRAPTGFGHALGALDLYLGPSREIAVVGAVDGPLLEEVWRRHLPNTVLAATLEPAEEIPLLAGKTPVAGVPAAYVCERFTCKQPVTSAAELAKQLEA